MSVSRISNGPSRAVMAGTLKEKGKRSDCDSDAHDKNASWPAGLYLFDIFDIH